MKNKILKFKTIFILGPPGSGKGTQCQILTRNFNILHISAGELLRREITKKNSPSSQIINICMQEGKIVPNEITCDLLRKEMEYFQDKYEYFLIDGYPRNDDNFIGWKKAMDDIVNLKMTIVLECDREALKQRILERSKFQGRTDDKIEILEKRLISYEKETLPVISKLSEYSNLLKIDGTRNIYEVSQDLQKGLKYLI